MSLRARAAIVYETAMIKKIGLATIHESIRPIHDAMDHLIKDSAKKVEDCHAAILQFRAVGAAKRQVAEELIEKAIEEEGYAALVEKALIRHMLELGVTEIVSSGSIATLVAGPDGSHKVQIR